MTNCVLLNWIEQPMMKRIELTHNQVAFVDESDYAALIAFSWHARYNKKNDCYYAARRIRIGKSRTSVHLHRQIMGLASGDLRFIEFLDKNTLNCCRSNLRISSQTRIQLNSKDKCRKQNVCRGVSRTPEGTYHTQIKFHGKSVYLGTYKTVAEASRVRTAYKAKLLKLLENETLN
jgi:hypothetical protein